MSKDCKKEAKDFDNAVHEMAYTIGQVWPILTGQFMQAPLAELRVLTVFEATPCMQSCVTRMREVMLTATLL